jgi:branched-chain amino acid transport system permease protein
LLGLFVLLLVAPHALQTVSAFYVSLATEIMILALFASSLNLLTGYGGMVTFGHAAYFGVASYALAILVKKAGVSLLTAFIVCPLFSLAAAAVFGFFCVRLTRVYFAMLTLAFAQIVYTVVFQWYALTGGDNGIPGMWSGGIIPSSVDSPVGYYYFTLILVSASLGTLYLIVSSPFGLALKATRENPQRTQFVGLNVRLHQYVAFVLAGFYAGVAGALFTFLKGGAYPDFVFWTKSAEPLVVSILGGMSYFSGPIVGAAVFQILQFVTNKYTEYWPLVLGAILVLLVLAAPRGLVGLYFDWKDRQG